MELGNQPVLTLGLAFVGLYILFAMFVSLPSLMERARRWKQRKSSESAFFPTATIAYDLVPKLRPFLPKKPTFYITAADGHPLMTKKLYPWVGFISEAVRNGSIVHYIMTDATTTDENKLLRIKSDIESGSAGKLNLYFIRSDLVDSKDEELVESLRTFHPMLVETRDERLMWIEGYHPANSTVAYSCEYVSPDKARNDPRYNRYKKALVSLITKYGAPKKRLAKAA